MRVCTRGHARVIRGPIVLRRMQWARARPCGHADAHPANILPETVRIVCALPTCALSAHHGVGSSGEIVRKCHIASHYYLQSFLQRSA